VWKAKPSKLKGHLEDVFDGSDKIYFDGLWRAAEVSGAFESG
jgi:hypothetical protein